MARSETISARSSDSLLDRFDPAHPEFSTTVRRLWGERLPEVDSSGLPLFVLANAVMLRFKAWQAEALSTYDINLSDFQILSTLFMAPDEALTASELRTILWLTPGGMTRTIKRLVDAGWLETHPCESDKRRSPVRLTALGKRRAREISRKVADFYAEAIASLSPGSERKIVEGMLLFLREVKLG